MTVISEIPADHQSGRGKKAREEALGGLGNGSASFLRPFWQDRR